MCDFKNKLEQFGIALPVDDVDEVYEFLLQYFEEYGRFLEAEHEVDEVAQKTSLFDQTGNIAEQITRLKQQGTRMHEEITTLLSRIKGNFPLKAESDSIKAAMVQISEKQNILEKKICTLEALAAEMDNDLQRQTDVSAHTAVSQQLAAGRTRLHQASRRLTSLLLVQQALADHISSRENRASETLRQKTAGYAGTCFLKIPTEKNRPCCCFKTTILIFQPLNGS
jgi:regulator of replication initiation timing